MPIITRPLHTAMAIAVAALTAAALPGTNASGEPPGASAAAPASPELSETSRLADRRSLVVGDRMYEISAEDGTTPLPAGTSTARWAACGPHRSRWWTASGSASPASGWATRRSRGHPHSGWGYTRTS